MAFNETGFRETAKKYGYQDSDIEMYVNALKAKQQTPEYRLKEAETTKKLKEIESPVNPSKYLNGASKSPTTRPPLDSFVIKDTTFQGGKQPFVGQSKQPPKEEPKKSFLRRV